ncbi:MAG: S8 family serine peptidase [Planctomycetaceae bacterium]
MISNSIEEEINAVGTAQVIVVLKPFVQTGAAASAAPSAALAAAIPVTASRSRMLLSSRVVAQVAAQFRFGESTQAVAMAASRGIAGSKSAGAKWFRSAAATNNPTPQARIYPNLGVMLGSVDKTGLKSLSLDQGVQDVLLAPRLSLIRPVRVGPAATSAAVANQKTWGIKRLKADKLHQQGIEGGGVIVGHLDTGVDGKHPALKNAIHAFTEIDDFGFEVTPVPAAHDTADHGTHTAGTIAGRPGGGHEIGVAPAAMLASAIVIEGGDVIARVLAGMDWAIGQGARILNMSLGLRGFHNDFLPLTQLLRQKGILPVFAVGNEGPGTSRSPGNYDEALSVGASAEDNSVPNFSSSRQFTTWLVPDVVAPGVEVISAMPGGGFQEMDGSSMATPHIAGLAALLWSAVPAATVDQVEQAIFTSCQKLPNEPDSRQNRGVPDAVAALAELRAAVSCGTAPASPASLKKAAKKKSPKASKKAAKKAPQKAKKAAVKNVKKK